MRRFAAVWRPGSGEQQWRTGMSVDEFKSHDTDFFKKGLRLADLSIRGDSVAAVWRAGSGEQHWRTGMSVDEFKAQDTGLFNKGLRLADLEIYNGRYAAVWRAGNGAQHWRSGMSADQLENEDSTQFAKGMRLLDVEAYDGDKFTAVWHSGTGETALAHGHVARRVQGTGREVLLPERPSSRGARAARRAVLDGLRSCLDAWHGRAALVVGHVGERARGQGCGVLQQRPEAAGAGYVVRSGVAAVDGGRAGSVHCAG